jgi:hypothetical protein
MTEDQEAQSERARVRGAAKARKMARLAWSQSSFDLLASGYTIPTKSAGQFAERSFVRRSNLTLDTSAPDDGDDFICDPFEGFERHWDLRGTD